MTEEYVEQWYNRKRTMPFVEWPKDQVPVELLVYLPPATQFETPSGSKIRRDARVYPIVKDLTTGTLHYISEQIKEIVHTQRYQHWLDSNERPKSEKYYGPKYDGMLMDWQREYGITQNPLIDDVDPEDSYLFCIPKRFLKADLTLSDLKKMAKFANRVNAKKREEAKKAQNKAKIITTV